MALRLRSPPPDMLELFRKAGAKYNIDPALLVAQARQESAFNPKAGSGQGARGVMQIMPATGADLGVGDPEDLYNPGINIDAGAKYMRQLLDRFGGDNQKALAAYNTGTKNVEKYGMDTVLGPRWNSAKNPGETGDYVRNILANYKGSQPVAKRNASGEVDIEDLRPHISGANFAILGQAGSSRRGVL